MGTTNIDREREEFVKQVAEHLKSSGAKFYGDINEPGEVVYKVEETGSAGPYDIVIRYTLGADRIRCYPPGYSIKPQFHLYLTTDYLGCVAASLSTSRLSTLNPKETAQEIIKRLRDGANRMEKHEADQWVPDYP
jgi:hypothetical protein